jgi:hypothetical protein
MCVPASGEPRLDQLGRDSPPPVVFKHSDWSQAHVHRAGGDRHRTEGDMANDRIAQNRDQRHREMTDVSQTVNQSSLGGA